MTVPFDHLSLLIDTGRLRRCVKAIARQIQRDFSALPEAEEPILVVVLKGGALFGMDLLRALRRPMPVVFVSRTGDLDAAITPDDQALLRGRHLIVVDALMDSGNSLQHLHLWLQKRQPLTIRLAVLLHKTVGHAEPLVVHYLGYEVPDVRLVGYGLDEEENFRGLPAVYAWWDGIDQPASPPQSASAGKQTKKKKWNPDEPRA